jgi:hypothetical protein
MALAVKTTIDRVSSALSPHAVPPSPLAVGVASMATGAVSVRAPRSVTRQLDRYAEASPGGSRVSPSRHDPTQSRGFSFSFAECDLELNSVGEDSSGTRGNDSSVPQTDSVAGDAPAVRVPTASRSRTGTRESSRGTAAVVAAAASGSVLPLITGPVSDTHGDALASSADAPLPAHLLSVDFQQGTTLSDAYRRSNIGRRPSALNVESGIATGQRHRMISPTPLLVPAVAVTSPVGQPGDAFGMSIMSMRGGSVGPRRSFFGGKAQPPVASPKAAAQPPSPSGRVAPVSPKTVSPPKSEPASPVAASPAPPPPPARQPPVVHTHLREKPKVTGVPVRQGLDTKVRHDSERERARARARERERERERERVRVCVC